MIETRVGIDIVEVSRINKLSEEHGHSFFKHVFTDLELSWCQERKIPEMHLAGRFAAKEAVKKALLSSGEKDIPLNKIVISRKQGCPPEAIIKANLNRKYVCHVSISHTNNLATAVAIVTPQ